jgi:hypothetical protein
MPTPSSDLPPWLKRSGPADRRRRNRPAQTAAGAVALFGAGIAIGWMVASRTTGAAPPPPVCPPLPPTVACPETPAAPPNGHPAPRPLAAATRAKTTRLALMPLPAVKPMDEGERTEALRAYASQKAPDLRECLADPDNGPPVKLGVAFEIAANGAVELVQILGADGAAKDVRRCWSKNLKRWRFPEPLLRGEEKLLVNFVL